MKANVIFYFGLLLTTRFTKAENATQATINDPMADISPMKSTAQVYSSHGNYENQAQSVDHQQPYANDGQVEDRSPSEPSTQKRDAEGGKITVTSHLQEELLRSKTEERSPTEGTKCSYTFMVAQPPKVGGEACTSSTTGSRESDKVLTKLHKDVLEAKLEIEGFRNELMEEKQRSRSGDEIEALEESVSLLQQESRNMDSRVSQLYMQLLHEIINKRDNTLEIQEMENKILNQSVEYFKLKEEHEVLKREHSAMKMQLQGQSDQLEELRQNVATLSKHPKRSKTVDPLLEVGKRRKPPRRKEPPSAPTSPATATAPTTAAKRALLSGPYRDCTEVQRAGYTKSGLFNLHLPGHGRRIRVWCDFDQDPGGWLVIQRRTGRRINFYRNMKSYKEGFGRPHSDFWLGLEDIHQLTNREGVNYKLHIDMEDWNDMRTFVEYKSFRVEGEETGYRLRITHYSGNAGDALTWHNNMSFTTSDQDNDPFGRNCAHYQRGGWWYNNCAHSNLNGIYYRGGYYRSRYQDGIYWSDWRGESYSLKSVSMKIRPTE